jgi:hypothetical protein
MVQAWRLYRLHKRVQFMLDRDKENTEQEAWEESVMIHLVSQGVCWVN